MTELHPCARCKRHIATSAASCPFCGDAVRRGAERELPLARLSRAAVFAGAALATGAACGGSAKAKPNDPQSDQRLEEREERRHSQNHGCPDPDPVQIERLEKEREAAQTEDEKTKLDQQLQVAKNPACMPYGAPPARRRVV